MIGLKGFIWVWPNIGPFRQPKEYFKSDWKGCVNLIQKFGIFLYVVRPYQTYDIAWLLIPIYLRRYILHHYSKTVSEHSIHYGRIWKFLGKKKFFRNAKWNIVKRHLQRHDIFLNQLKLTDEWTLITQFRALLLDAGCNIYSRYSR